MKVVVTIVACCIIYLLGCAKTPIADRPVASPGSGGLATTEDLINEDLDDASIVDVADPLEPLNRATFALNDKLYAFIVEPVSNAYGAVTPDLLETGIANAFTNLRYPKRLAGNLMQGKLEGAAKETGKFVLNSTVGVLGLGTPSDLHEGLQTPSEDLGQTLGKWRLGHGPYIVWPMLGPSTLRDTTGMIGDGFLDPINYLGSTGHRLGARGLDILNQSPSLVADYNALKESAIDPYTSLRNAYVQSRQRQVAE